MKKFLKRKLDLDIGIGLDVGQTRKGQPNQDAVGMVLPGVLNSRPPLFILADGMGGHNGGAIASHTVVEVVKRCYRHYRVTDPLQVIETLIQKAHEEIKALGDVELFRDEEITDIDLDKVNKPL